MCVIKKNIEDWTSLCKERLRRHPFLFPTHTHILHIYISVAVSKRLDDILKTKHKLQYYDKRDYDIYYIIEWKYRLQNSQLCVLSITNTCWQLQFYIGFNFLFYILFMSYISFPFMIISMFNRWFQNNDNLMHDNDVKIVSLSFAFLSGTLGLLSNGKGCRIAIEWRR